MSDDLTDDLLGPLHSGPVPPLAAGELVRARGEQRAGRTRARLAGAGALVVLAAAGVGYGVARGGDDDALRLAAPPPATATSSVTPSVAPSSAPAPRPSTPPATPALPVPSASAPAATPSATSPVPTPSTSTWPPALQSLEHGGTSWAVYVSVVRLATDGSTGALDQARLAAAVQSLEAVGYQAASGPLGCDAGFKEGLGLLPDRDYAGVPLYFATAADAQRFVDLYQPGVVGTVQVQTYCLD